MQTEDALAVSTTTKRQKMRFEMCFACRPTSPTQCSLFRKHCELLGTHQGLRCDAIDQEKQENSSTCNVDRSRTIPLTISLGFLDFFRGGAGFFLGEAMSEGFAADGSPLLA